MKSEWFKKKFSMVFICKSLKYCNIQKKKCLIIANEIEFSGLCKSLKNCNEIEFSGQKDHNI